MIVLASLALLKGKKALVTVSPMTSRSPLGGALVPFEPLLTPK